MGKRTENIVSGTGEATAGGTTPTNVQGDGQEPVNGGERTFTQRELDAIIADRLRRNSAQYADYDELREKADKLVQLEQAQMSELEQAKARATALEAERDLALQQANDRLITAAIISEAARLDFADPNDAFALADLAGIQVNDAGKVEGAGEAVKALAESRPYLINKRQAPNDHAGAGGGERLGGRSVVLSDEELAVAARLRITPQQYAEQKAKIVSRRK